ncbi:unnamed protein product [Auanema sp. JU1783]|nr:unnamed protein product [Auanema sp. JU1783]
MMALPFERDFEKYIRMERYRGHGLLESETDNRRRQMKSILASAPPYEMVNVYPTLNTHIVEMRNEVDLDLEVVAPRPTSLPLELQMSLKEVAYEYDGAQIARALVYDYLTHGVSGLHEVQRMAESVDPSDSRAVYTLVPSSSTLSSKHVELKSRWLDAFGIQSISFEFRKDGGQLVLPRYSSTIYNISKVYPVYQYFILIIIMSKPSCVTREFLTLTYFL